MCHYFFNRLLFFQNVIYKKMILLNLKVQLKPLPYTSSPMKTPELLIALLILYLFKAK